MGKSSVESALATAGLEVAASTAAAINGISGAATRSARGVIEPPSLRFVTCYSAGNLLVEVVASLAG
jgi:hypothetical protein